MMDVCMTTRLCFVVYKEHINSGFNYLLLLPIILPLHPPDVDGKPQTVSINYNQFTCAHLYFEL